jgi:hypothetical protein
MQIGGWKRIGIVASVVWMLGGAISYHLYEVAALDTRDMSTFNLCYKARTQGSNYDGIAALKTCGQNSRESRSQFFETIWTDDLSVALVPVPLGWLAAYICLSVFRWVKRGFA